MEFLKNLEQLMDAHNMNRSKVYKEVVSGENLDARPQARLMLDDVADKLYDGVVVVELERLSRGNQIDQVEILETFKKTGTKIYTLNKTYDLASDNEFDEEFFEFGLFMSRREYKIINCCLMIIVDTTRILRAYMGIRACDNLFKLSGVGEPLQKVASVLSWNFKHFIPSRQGVERLSL